MIKIIDNTLKEYTFYDLGVGATFKYKDNYFIKIELVEHGLHEWNAIKLNNGELISFDDDAKVTPFNCELIIL